MNQCMVVSFNSDPKPLDSYVTLQTCRRHRFRNLILKQVTDTQTHLTNNTFDNKDVCTVKSTDMTMKTVSVWTAV